MVNTVHVWRSTQVKFKLQRAVIRSSGAHLPKSAKAVESPEGGAPCERLGWPRS